MAFVVLSILMYFFSGSYIGFGAFILLSTRPGSWRSCHCSQPVRLLVTTSTGQHCSKHFEWCVSYATTSRDTQRIVNDKIDKTLTRIRDRCIPYVQGILSWPPLYEDNQLEFHILGVAYQDTIRNENLSCFVPRLSAQDLDVLVKFARYYSSNSTDLHD